MSPEAFIPKVLTIGPIIHHLSNNPTKARLEIPTSAISSISNFSLFVGLSQYVDARNDEITWEQVTNNTLYTFTSASGRFAWIRIIGIDDVIDLVDRSVTDNPITLELV